MIKNDMSASIPSYPGHHEPSSTTSPKLPISQYKKHPKGRLVLSSGECLEGTFIGDPRACRGELVFTTSLVGYSESLTDPSYFGQILTFAYPLIGNYGIPSLEMVGGLPPLGYESPTPYVSGVIINHHCEEAFHYQSTHNLSNWLASHGVPGLVGVDTRHLIHMIRDHAPLLGRMELTTDTGPERQLHGWQPPGGDFFDASQHALFDYVSCTEPILHEPSSHRQPNKHKTPRVALIDCGVKSHIIRQLLSSGCEVLQIPWKTPLSSVDCSGWVISNGPGDPAFASSLVGEVGQLLDEHRPILGICLGHQILGLAAGMHCERMTYGHRSHNQPVYLVGERKCYITSQNHGFHLIEHPTSKLTDWHVWFRNANDGSIEGIRHNNKPFRSVQFHPEASGGPRDTNWIIEEFCHDLTTAS